eukprot:CAMPEP_0185782852 /NCGR_PEP_ID=MMETSP1174-20130828/112353_1 /TAXON_ID=35687 /ORGANISM="Dictyocha speculum, Strain CCMP1381" /LENGTH=59 /DNA_ID=CAMNT_0028473571 /DNA_START=130 /DNA_END=305 /DNA_ORIENTATION=-
MRSPQETPEELSEGRGETPGLEERDDVSECTPQLRHIGFPLNLVPTLFSKLRAEIFDAG